MTRRRRFEARLAELVDKAKKLIRPELKPEDWSAMNLKTIGIKPSLGGGPFREDLEVSIVPSVELFERLYKATGTPAIINGIVDEWPAYKKWTMDMFATKFANQYFKIGEDDHGKAVKMRMKYFAEYLKNNTDDAPLNIFDSTFGERTGTRKLLADYTEPPYFADNWFRFSDFSRTPPSRWIVIGPALSGTGIHVDPMGTSAWNGLIKGIKLWALFPPATPKKMLKIPKNAEGKTLGDEAVRWIRTVLPETAKDSWPDEYKPLIHVQREGDLIFVPSGWWHVVLNVTDTIAVTENFCDHTNFLNCYNATYSSRRNFCLHWLQTIRRSYPKAVSMFPTVFQQLAPEGNESESSTSESSCSSSDEDCDADSDSDCPCSNPSVNDSSNDDEIPKVSRKRTAGTSSSAPPNRRRRRN